MNKKLQKNNCLQKNLIILNYALLALSATKAKGHLKWPLEKNNFLFYY
jgi:hypothetical protein